MIICHPLKLIFLKTKKTAGTSFEIALSSFCGPECVITPISVEDEDLRHRLGYRSAQNYSQPTWPDGTQSSGAFFNHMTSCEARRLVPEDIWTTYRKVTIVRDPFDAIISRYHWEGGNKTGLDFGQFVDSFRSMLSENSVIAPASGAYAMDSYLRFEDLEGSIKALDIEALWDRFHQIQAKSKHRPRQGTQPEELYRKFPEAARIVAKECEPELRTFGYTTPPTYSPRQHKPNSSLFDYYFTVTAGRTATAWLSKLLSLNLNIPSRHEPLGVDDFGTQMPDIRTMRSFNTYGMDRTVRNFWKRKFQDLNGPIAETNHTLGKCGLVEYIADDPISDRAALIVLRRNLVDQCVSYIMRGDFANVTLEWQWYLSPSYRNVMVKPDLFVPLGQIGNALWYCLEMETRQAYYLKKFGHRLNFIEANVEEVVTHTGAQKFLQKLGHSGAVILPERTNANQADAQTQAALKEQVARTLESLNFDPESIATAYIQRGRRLGWPSITHHAA